MNNTRANCSNNHKNKQPQLKSFKKVAQMPSTPLCLKHIAKLFALITIWVKSQKQKNSQNKSRKRYHDISDNPLCVHYDCIHDAFYKPVRIIYIHSLIIIWWNVAQGHILQRCEKVLFWRNVIGTVHWSNSSLKRKTKRKDNKLKHIEKLKMFWSTNRRGTTKI